MASLANANLPSSDEEDDDYNPTLDPTGEKEPGQQQQQQGGANRKRCVVRTRHAVIDARDARI